MRIITDPVNSSRFVRLKSSSHCIFGTPTECKAGNAATSSLVVKDQTGPTGRNLFTNQDRIHTWPLCHATPPLPCQPETETQHGHTDRDHERSHRSECDSFAGGR